MEPGCNTDFDMDATPAPSGDGMDQLMSMLQHQQTTMGDEQFDRQMLRYLMSKYSIEGIARLMQEETSFASSDRRSILTSSSLSSTNSDHLSLFDSAHSIRTLSESPSNRSSSIISNVSAKTAKLLGRRSHSNASSTSLPSTSRLQHQPSSSSSLRDTESIAESIEEQNGLTTSAAKQKGTFVCGFCREEGIQKSCTRKNDLKRHIEDFHHMNAQWFCNQRGCNMVFDWQTAYKTHLKLAHGGARIALDDAKVNLCPQTVFACGFDGCLSVFESPSDADSGATFKEYVGHVVKHFDEGSDTGKWTYSTRMRNLLRQSGILGAWTNSSWPEEERDKLVWQPQLSGILRKKLETRHLGDTQMLVQYAIAVASEPASVPDPRRHGLVVPIREECTMQIPGHKNRLNSVDAAAPEPEQYQFRISRGNNPALANYLAHQRRMQSTPARPPVRAGRSARPPVRTLHTHAQQNHVPGQAFPPQVGPNMFDPNNQFYTQPQNQNAQQQQQQFMMQPSNGTAGIIADDLRSLRSIASSGTGESGDVDMGDSYQQQQNFSGPYIAGGLTSQASVGNLTSPVQQGQYPHPGYASSAHTF